MDFNVLLVLTNLFCIGYISYTHSRMNKQDRMIRLLQLNVKASDNILFDLLERGIEPASKDYKEAQKRYERFKTLSPEYQAETIKAMLKD